MRRGDRRGPRQRSDPSVAKLKQVLHVSALENVFDVLGVQTPRFSRWGGASQARLDRVYATNDFTGGVENYDVNAIALSDHGLVSVAFSLVQEQSIRRERQSVWKMNNSILDDKDFIKIIEDRIIEMVAGEPVSAPEWDIFKAFVARTAKNCGAKQAARNRAEQRALEESLQTLIRAEEESPGIFVQDIREVKQ